LDCDTLVLTHVLVTAPRVHPVVRPTLLTVVPTVNEVAAFSPVIVNVGAAASISSEPLLAPVVRAICPTAPVPFV
jgi:fatty acid/phospholipid biosynthesis enzyme